MLQISQSQTWERNTFLEFLRERQLIDNVLTPEPSRPSKYYLAWPQSEERSIPFSKIRTVSNPSHWNMKGKKYLLFLDPSDVNKSISRQFHCQLWLLKAGIGVHACGSEEQFNISPARLFCLPARWICGQFSSTLPFCRIKESSHSDYLYKASITVWITVKTFWAPEHPS